MIIRQGDVLISQITKLPDNLEKLDHKIVAHGESGHFHRLEKGTIYETKTAERLMFIEIKEPTKIVHEEHKAIRIEPGFYEVKREREFDPFADVIREVRD